jgi:hypothetical protein
MHYWLCVTACLIAASGTAAQAAVSDSRPLRIGAVTPLSSSVARYGRAEFQIDLQGTYANAFDPDEIDMQGHFTEPDGTVLTVPAFYFQDYTRTIQNNQDHLTLSGASGWRMRFAPTQVGRYTVSVTARDKSGKQVKHQPIAFQCAASDDPGFIRRSRDDSRYFVFDNRKPYVPIGANVCWAGSRGTLDYDDWLPRYGDAGCSYFRVWLGPGWTTFGMEHTGDGFGLGKFDQEKAWRLDYVLDLARKHGLYVMLCMDSYNELRRKSEGGYGCWEDTPHTAANGGPLSAPGDFWTNPTMLRLYKNKLRYLVARYGWNTHVMSWEFWNEVDIISSDAYRPDQVTRWHAEMSDYLRSIDPYKHLRTTSFASSGGKPEIDKLPQMDYTQTHCYGLADGAPELVGWQRKKLEYHKPSYVGEFGADAGGSDRAVDPDGILLHNGMWSTLMTGSAGSAMLWWWDSHIAPGNLYYHFAALSAFVKGVNFPREGFETINNATLSVVDPSAETPWRDLMLRGPASWEPSEANKPTEVKIGSDGTVVVRGEVAGILHGNVNHPNLHNPLTFELDLPHPTRVRINVSGVSGYGGAHLVAVLDTAAILDTPMPDANPPGKHDTLQQYNGEYAIDVSAGPHVLKIENTGTDWMLVSYILERAERKRDPDLRVYGMRGKTVSLIWVQNAAHTHSRVHAAGHEPEAVPQTVLTIPDWPKGTYRVLLWDTYAGREIRSETVTADGKGLRLKLSAIPKDVALKIERT